MKTKKNNQTQTRTSKAYKPGEYYKVYLARGDYKNNSIEYFTVGISGKSGEIIDTDYNGQTIRQYNGLMGEKFVLDMIDNSGWREIT